MKVLILNAGSTSMKFKLYDMSKNGYVLAEGNFQRVGTENGWVKYVTAHGSKKQFEQPLPTHEDALQKIIELITTGETKVLESIQELGAVGHRVANGGAKLVKSTLITEEVIQEAVAIQDITPLHTPPQVATIRACQKLLGENFPMVAGFDTAFHQTMPPVSYIFGIPYEYYEKYGIRRLGFHGLSHQFIVERYGEILGHSLEGTKIVTCHLGGGSSVTAVKDGKTMDNTFGVGTGEGPIGGTRAGTFDHVGVGLIMSKENLSYDEVEDILHRKAGLLGISGVSGDEREVEEAAAAGNERAKLSLDVMAHQIKKYIGSYAFELGGLDTIIFTGGVGENSDLMRSLICQGLEAFGIKLDPKANVEHNRTEHCISAEDSKVAIWIIPTNEELVIARDTYHLVQAIKQ